MAITAQTILETDFGDFQVAYHQVGQSYEVVSFSQGTLTTGSPIIRIHSACLFGEVFHSQHCDCEEQITETMKAIQKHGHGAIIYCYQEGRGVGLLGKIKAMEVERREHVDTVEAFKRLGYKADTRDFSPAIAALRDLVVGVDITTFSGNPKKIKALQEAGYNVKRLLNITSDNLGKRAKEELKTKQNKLGYYYQDLT